MRLAVIDIGSNTVRLLVARAEGPGLAQLRHERNITRLAADIEKENIISDRPLSHTCRAVADFVTMAKKDGATHILASATSAIREAVNGREARAAIEKASGIKVKVLSGQEEAETTALGVLNGLNGITDAIIFDLGGGSTEFITVRGGGISSTASIPTGVVKLYDSVITTEPPSEDDLSRLDCLCAEWAKAAKEALNTAGINQDNAVLIGTAGTATTLAAVDLSLKVYDWQKVQGHEISVEKLLEIEQRLAGLTPAERRQVDGVEPGREDLIIAGARFTIKVMEAFGFKRLVVSDHGLLEGLAKRLKMMVEEGAMGYELL